MSENSMSGTCTYDLAWVGKCKADCESDRCATHAEITCVVCKRPASHECSHTGQFVCGAPLCDQCEGFVDRTRESGSWGFMNHGHRTKLQHEDAGRAAISREDGEQ